MKLHLGDSLELLKDHPGNYFDSCVTDPPYGLKFMNKHWDYDVPSVELWSEVLRVLKPGAHILAFGGTRTYHRLAVNIEDAGFEIRDQIQWLYGSGFPKSHNISKGIDKKFGAEREVVGVNSNCNGRPKAGYGGALLANSNQGNSKKDHTENAFKITAPATSQAKQYDGWGTALKPANEPIVLARKPLSEKTIVDNVLKWGTGGINVDGCRIEGDYKWRASDSNQCSETFKKHYNGSSGDGPNPQGRFPANIILDETAADMLDEQSGVSHSKPQKRTPRNVYQGNSLLKSKTLNTAGQKDGGGNFSDSGGASRFFYVAKASKRERNQGLEHLPEIESGIGDERPSGQSMQRLDGREARSMQNHHPTVKPIKLMEYLCRLITPPNGRILDPFMGSGSTGVAAGREGFEFCGIEIDPDYYAIAKMRNDKVLSE